MSATINRRKFLFLAFIFLVSLLGILIFNGIKIQIKHQDMASFTSTALHSVPESAWQSLSTKRIIFGHQFVGFNIIQGMEELLGKNPSINLEIIDTSRYWEIEKPGFFHFQVEENTQPQTKIDDFIRVVESTEEHGAIDIAFFKFCYVDIDPDTNVVEVFTQYKQGMQQLSQAFPQTTFIYVTVPLESEASGIRKWAKRVKYSLQQLLDKSQQSSHFSANFYRNEFNALIRKEFEGKAPIFDLAQIESTYPNAYPNGEKRFSMVDERPYFSLVLDYTDDGGHLNQLGRQIVAEKLLVFLAQLSLHD
ncbi:hypothetical protein [Trichothermofontia sp.]